VNYLGENVTYTPEAVMGMILGDVKLIGERDSGGPITDCVISVPVYFTDAERHAMLDASKIAGLNCLRLMNDTAATALGYGIYKTDLPEDKPIHTVIVDAGEMALQVRFLSFLPISRRLERSFHGWLRGSIPPSLRSIPPSLYTQISILEAHIQLLPSHLDILHHPRHTLTTVLDSHHTSASKR
jgi:hypothetical protein